jgi:phage host-nuclease inhibitor protein Gam
LADANEEVDIREVRRQANELLKAITITRRSRLLKQARLNRRVEALQERFGAEIEELKQHEVVLVEQLKNLVLPHFKQLVVKGTKTIKLRYGNIRLRRASMDTLELSDDEAKIIRRIARHRGLKKFTRLKRILDKEALKRNPAFVTKIQGLAIIRKTSLIISPNNIQGEIAVTADPLTINMPEED